MNAIKLFFVPLFLIMFMAIYNLPVSAEICNRIVAAVNEEIITLYELNGRIKELTGSEPLELKKKDKAGFIEARRNVLDLLIDEKISHDKIVELGIEVSPKEMDAAIEQIKTRNNWTHEDLMSGLKKQGTNYEEYRKKMRTEIEQMRLVDFEVKSKIIIRDDTIKRYHEDHLDEYKSEEKVRLAIILLTEDASTRDGKSSLSQRTKEIISRLKNGEDFAVLASTFSNGPGAEDGGDLGFIRTAQLDPKLKRIIHKLNVGDMSEPIMTPAGIQIIKVLEKQDKGVKTLEQVRETIYESLYREEVNKRFMAWIKELRETAFIKVIF